LTTTVVDTVLLKPLEKAKELYQKWLCGSVKKKGMSVGQKLVRSAECGPCYLDRSIFDSGYLIEELDYTIHCSSDCDERQSEREREREEFKLDSRFLTYNHTIIAAFNCDRFTALTLSFFIVSSVVYIGTMIQFMVTEFRSLITDYFMCENST
jgi:hypothetical protein